MRLISFNDNRFTAFFWNYQGEPVLENFFCWTS